MLKTNSSTCLFIVILNFIFSIPLLQAFYQQRRYVHVPRSMTWSSAQKYCRENHIDLATFRDLDEYNALQSPCPTSCWIGLQRDKNDSNVWNWSDGDESSFTRWHSSQPDNVWVNQNCVVIQRTYWYDRKCDTRYTFLCYDDFILVKEKKTWEEAMEHCTNKSNLYNLPHMTFGVNNSHARKVILDAQTPEVWIGLRFLAGEWLWVDGMLLRQKLPVCPAARMYCGTMSKMGELLPLRDCLEERNFLCSKKN